MDSTPNLPGNHAFDGSTLAVGVKRRSAQTRRNVAIILWLLGFIAFVGASVIVKFHPAPWPVDLQTTITLQHLPLWSWLLPLIRWPSIAGDPLPSVIYPLVWFVVLSLIAVVARLRGGSPIPWFVAAIFLFGTFVMFLLFFLPNFMVARPRPSSPLIHVVVLEPIPTFPSGHVVYAVVYYGFLLYLSLTKPISQWRYRWILIPFQLYAVLMILLIGFSRVFEGTHWLTDVLGGYLLGALFLALLIVLYRWALERMTRRHEKRLAEKSAQNQHA